MSYIRSGCNPESLYVFGSVGDHHDFSWTDHNDAMQTMSMPSDDFDEFFTRFKKWDDEHDLWDEVFEYKGISLRTVTFHEGLKRILTDEEIAERDKIHMFDREGRTNRLICLTYNDYPPLIMWEVTWDRLRESAYDSLFGVGQTASPLRYAVIGGLGLLCGWLLGKGLDWLWAKDGISEIFP